MITDRPKDFPGTLSYSELQSMATEDRKTMLEKLNKEGQSDDAFNIQFTSGTTGSPKGATLSYFGLMNAAYYSGQRLSAGFQVRTKYRILILQCFFLWKIWNKFLWSSCLWRNGLVFSLVWIGLMWSPYWEWVKKGCHHLVVLDFSLQTVSLACPLPLYHVFGCVGNLVLSTIYGLKVVFPSAKFDAEAVVRGIQEEKVQCLSGENWQNLSNEVLVLLP